MPSMTPSEYKQLQRTDSGPFLTIKRIESPENIVHEEHEDENVEVKVYFSDVPPEAADLDDFAHLLTVCSDRVEIYPINVRPDKDDFLTPKYDGLKCIIVTRRIAYPYSLPETAEDVEELLESLPAGFSKNFRFGLGLLWEYRLLCETIGKLEGVDTLMINGGSERPHVVGSLFVLTLAHFHEFRKEQDRITSRYQRGAKQEKEFLFYHSILHASDPSRFPKKQRRLAPGTLSEMRKPNRGSVALSKDDQRTVVQIVTDNVAELASNEPVSLMRLKGDIELVTLNKLIDRYGVMLQQNLAEPKWQAFFKENPFILSLAFAVPFMMVQSQAYAGGKRISGKGGKYPDFIYAAISTGNLAIIEIKKPSTDLLLGSSYRGADVFGLSAEISGAVAQVLSQREALQRNLPNMKVEEDLPDIHGFSTRCVVLAGRNPTDKVCKKSFELQRNAMTEVTVVTFDELYARLISIREALTPPPLEDDIPF